MVTQPHGWHMVRLGKIILWSEMYFYVTTCLYLVQMKSWFQSSRPNWKFFAETKYKMESMLVGIIVAVLAGGMFLKYCWFIRPHCQRICSKFNTGNDHGQTESLGTPDFTTPYRRWLEGMRGQGCSRELMRGLRWSWCWPGGKPKGGES